MDIQSKEKNAAFIDPKESMLEKFVQIVTSDGRIFIGKFLFDGKTYKKFLRILERFGSSFKFNT